MEAKGLASLVASRTAKQRVPFLRGGSELWWLVSGPPLGWIHDYRHWPTCDICPSVKLSCPINQPIRNNYAKDFLTSSWKMHNWFRKDKPFFIRCNPSYVLFLRKLRGNRTYRTGWRKSCLFETGCAFFFLFFIYAVLRCH